MTHLRPTQRPAAAMAPAAMALALATALSFSPAPLRADQTDSAVYDFSLRGIPVGTLSLSGAVRGQSYVTTGKLNSSGLVGVIRKVSYDAKARGTTDGASFVPSRYEERADTGKRQSEAVMDYEGGIPQIKLYNPPRKPKDHDLDPTTQGGTLDPLSAAYFVMRDIPKDSACTLSLDLFDGKRRSQVVLSDPEPGKDGITCSGEYRRVAGFSKDDMAEKTRFPFTLHYAEAGDGMLRIDRITMDSIYGQGMLKRR